MDHQPIGRRQPGSRTRARAKVEDSRTVEETTSALAGHIQNIPLDEIVITGRNPRRSMEGLEELTASIREHGLLQPLVVRGEGDRFELIAGHRRYEALKQLGWQEAPAIVRAANVDQAYILTLVENLQRADLRATEEAAALETLVRERGWTTRQVAAAIKRSQAYVSKRLRVFEDPLLAPAVLANQLSVSAAEELLTLGDSSRYELLSQAVEQHWDRQRVRAAARDRFTASRRRGRPPGLTRRIHGFRAELRSITPEQLTEADRRELRLLFSELALLARAPTGPRRRIFPALPVR